jgi:hypothetical protein
MVKFSTELDPVALPSALSMMTGIVDWATWQQRIDSLRAELKSNPFWERFLLERHGLELAFGDVKRHLRTTDRCPWPPRNAEEYYLYSFLAVAVRVHARLSPAGQAKFAGAIRSGLEKEFGLGPLAYEMKVAALLMSAGFDVDFHDLESGGGYDFLATCETMQIEVECKHVSADIGRQIHRRRIYDLGGVLFLSTWQAQNTVTRGRLVGVTLPGRLTSNKADQEALVKRIDAVLTNDANHIDDDVCRVTVQDFPLEGSPFCSARGHSITMADIADYLSNTLGIDNEHVLLNWSPGKTATIVHFQSRKRDEVLESLLRKLKSDAKKQFSGTLPGLLCVHLADVSENQLRDLANLDRSGTVTGLQRASSILLQSRPHLHSIALMANGQVRLTRERSHNRITTIVQETGPSYVFRNPEHPMAQNPLLNTIFF